MKQLTFLASSAEVVLRSGFGLRALADDSTIPQAKWNQVFPMGTHHNGGWPKSGVTVDKEFCETVVANWKKIGKPRLVVDYFHKTNDESAANSERIAAGWMTDLEARADGVWALMKWTERARTHILADELSGISPEFAINGMDPKTGKPQGPTLICAALLTNPAFKEMPRVAAAAVPLEAPKETIMNKLQMLALLAMANIKMAAETPDAEVTARLEKYVADTAALKAAAETEAAALKAKADETAAAALKAKEAAEATTASLKAELDAEKTNVLKLDARLAQLEKTSADAGINQLLARAKAEGRITAAAAEKNVRAYAEKMGLQAASEFVDSFPKGVVAPVGQVLGHGGAGNEGEPVDLKALSAKYGAELDAAIKAGATVGAATKAANAKPEFAPLFSRAVVNAKSTDAN